MTMQLSVEVFFGIMIKLIAYDRFFHDVGEKIEENETTLSFAHLAQIHFFNGFRLQ